MGNLRSVAVSVAALALCAASLSAQTGTGQVQWKGVNGAWSSFSNSATGPAQWNVYTSPYRAAFQINEAPSPYLPPAGTSTFGPTVDIFCVDFTHYANTGTYNAYFTNLGTDAADVGITTRTHSLTQYLEAAYLAGAYYTNTSAAGDINGAIWQIMNGEPLYRYNGTSWDASGINYWVGQATNNWQSVDASQWVVVTDQLGAKNDNTGSQEYLTQVTPEPATLLLLGTGLLAMIGAATMKRTAV